MCIQELSALSTFLYEYSSTFLNIILHALNINTFLTLITLPLLPTRLPLSHHEGQMLHDGEWPHEEIILMYVSSQWGHCTVDLVTVDQNIPVNHHTSGRSMC